MSTHKNGPAAQDDRLFALYIRRSDEDDSGKSVSIDNQIQRGHRFAQSIGYPADRVRVYEEFEGAKGWWWFRQSGRQGPYREELSKMLDDFDAGLIGACWTWRSDRIVRDTEVALAMVPYFARNGVRLWCGVREIDATTSEGLYNLTIEAASNRRYRDRVSEDSVRDKLFRAEIGLFTRDPGCYGWRSKGRDTQEAVPQWHEIAVTEMMMRWFTVGDGAGAPLNLNQIANRLMDLGIPLCVSAKGHKVRDHFKVTYAQVRRIISNPMHIGKWSHGGEEWDFSDKLLVSKDGEPRRTAIPLELFEAVKARLAEVERPGLVNDRTERLCSGLAVCHICGESLHTNVKAYKNGVKFERYYCAHRSGRRKTCLGDGYASLAVQELENWVTGQLAPLLADQLQAMQAEAGGEHLRKDLIQMERRLADARRTEADRLTQLLDVLDKDQIAGIATQLRAERQRLERECQAIRDQLSAVESVEANPASLLTTCPSRLREALRRAVKFIAIGSTGVTVLTRSGRYLWAPLIDRDLSIYSEADYRRRVEPSVQGIDAPVFPDRTKFLCGRRRALGKASDLLTDEQVLPTP